MSDPLKRNNVRVAGNPQADRTMLFAHGFGCDQTVWSRLAPAFERTHRCVFLDYVGAGGTCLEHYDPVRYASLKGYAQDVLDVIEALDLQRVVFVGHSVSAMVGVLASIARPERFSRLVLIGPSPCYVNEDEYVGGFTRQDIDGLLEMIERDYAGWARALAPVIMGNPDRPQLAADLEALFCRTDEHVAQRFARVTFLSDNRADVPRVTTPALILQCSHDAIAPDVVGEYLSRTMPGSSLVKLSATGHCPQLSAPQETVDAMRAWLG